jgi:hypothetical protein
MVNASDSREESQCNQGIEKIAGAARIQTKAALKVGQRSDSRASSVKTPSSIALSRVLEDQNARPV